jgi:MOSC domain-containing protein YiiM
VAVLLSVNVGRLQPNANRRSHRLTGIDKRPTASAIEVRAPGEKRDGPPQAGGAPMGSGLVGDEIGDHRHHGGDEQAVYAYAREELDDWEQRLGRELRNGMFGENLTTRGLVVSDAVIGERWQIGDVVLQVTGPRIPCGTFRDHMAEKGWLRTFALVARSGAYLKVVTPGTVRAGDEVTVVHRPDHDVTSRLAFRALTRERGLLPGLLGAGDDLPEELREMAEAGETYHLS